MPVRSWASTVASFHIRDCVGEKCIMSPTVVPLRFSTLPMNDNTAQGTLSTRSPLFSTHCKKFFSNEPDFSLIDQFVTRNHPNLENTLSNLKRCDAARLETFYRSAFERLDLQACEAIWHLWREALSPEGLFGIQNTYSKELTRPGLCFQDPSSFIQTDH